MIDKHKFLLDDKREVRNEIDIIENFITEEKLNKDIELSTSDIYYNFVESKINKINGLSPISSIQFESKLIEGEKAYLEYRMDDALEVFKVLAEKGVGRAMYFLGELYIQGYIEKDREKSKFWRRSGYEENDTLSYLNYAYSTNDKEQKNRIFNEIFSRVLELAEQGDIFAQNEIADMYYFGYGTDKDLKRSVHWLTVSSEKGNFRSINKLAGFYYKGIGVEQDFNVALILYKQAAEIGEPYCQATVGNHYYSGKCIGQDYYEAVKWYRKSAEQGFAPAMTNVGYAYQFGRGVPLDEKVAVKWYKKGAEAGSKVSQFNLAACYYDGIGIEKNIEIAKEWYIKSAKQGNKDAIKALKKYYKIRV